MLYAFRLAVQYHTRLQVRTLVLVAETIRAVGYGALQVLVHLGIDYLIQ
jgi:hypothetical protein